MATDRFDLAHAIIDYVGAAIDLAKKEVVGITCDFEQRYKDDMEQRMLNVINKLEIPSPCDDEY